MERELILNKVNKLIELYDQGMIPTLSKHEVNPELDKSSRLHYIYFTLPVSINFQRSSPAMWAAALKTFNDPETNYLFYPEKVVEIPREKIQQDLIKHKLGLQKNKHTDIWMKLSKTLHDYYHDDPRMIIKEGQSSVVRIKEILQEKRKPDFPYLSGTKIANYWLYILSKYTDVKLADMHNISIIPDTHVIQASKILGLSEELEDPKTLEKKWYDLLKGTEIAPVKIHPVLWNWSRNNFMPEV